MFALVDNTSVRRYRSVGVQGPGDVVKGGWTRVTSVVGGGGDMLSTLPRHQHATLHRGVITFAALRPVSTAVVNEHIFVFRCRRTKQRSHNTFEKRQVCGGQVDGGR
jgi:hypothetical protein